MCKLLLLFKLRYKLHVKIELEGWGFRFWFTPISDQQTFIKCLMGVVLSTILPSTI